MLVTPRDYQEEAIQNIRGSYINGYRAPLLVLSTGSGKTVVFCAITERVAAKRRKVYILVHRQELLRQTSEHLTLLGVAHGCIAPGYCMTGDPVQVASVQTLVRRLSRLPTPDLLIIDECHHSNAGTWREIITTWSASRVLGVTATPCRMDGTGLGQQAGGFFDLMIEGPSIRALIDSGYLSQPIVYAPPTDVNLDTVRIRAGDYEQHELSVRMDKPKITGSAIEHYSRLCPNMPAIAFCSSVEHSEHVAKQFNEAGIPSVSLTGDLPDTVRKHRIQSLAHGGIKVLTSCDIISEGTDIPVVAAAILLRPTQSLTLFLQQCGRALRVYPGKTHSVILDHVGNCLRHGMPDDVREWSLNAEKPTPRKRKEGQEEEAQRLRMCDKCYAVMPATKLVCPQCGHVHHANGREIKQVDGTLVEMNRDMAERMRIRNRQEVGMAQSLKALIELGKSRNCKPGWAYHVYNGRKAKEFQQKMQMTGT
jgi:DNA repair protein RadD